MFNLFAADSGELQDLPGAGDVEADAVRKNPTPASAENEAQTLRFEYQQLTFAALVAGIFALAVFFTFYMRARHRAAMRLAEVKAEQERIQSELRIARDIQMSMVPAAIPADRSNILMSSQKTGRFRVVRPKNWILTSTLS